jgi:Lar family restriction alleviation protein
MTMQTTKIADGEIVKFTDGGRTIHLTLTTADAVLPCPFCGSTDLELQNTHTPHYWIECQGCEAQVSDPGHGRRNTLPAHRASKAAVLAAWNRRALPTTPAPTSEET